MENQHKKQEYVVNAQWKLVLLSGMPEKGMPKRVIKNQLGGIYGTAAA